MCGEDGTQRGVYKLKEEHEEKEIGREKEKCKRHKQERREQAQKERIVLITKENDRCTNFRPLIYLRVNLFKRDRS